jgi:hypothetical protein
MIKRRPIFVVIEERRFDDAIEEGSLEYEPFNILQRRVDAICELTGCTEREAQRLVFDLSDE